MRLHQCRDGPNALAEAEYIALLPLISNCALALQGLEVFIDPRNCARLGLLCAASHGAAGVLPHTPSVAEPKVEPPKLPWRGLFYVLFPNCGCIPQVCLLGGVGSYSFACFLQINCVQLV